MIAVAAQPLTQHARLGQHSLYGGIHGMDTAEKQSTFPDFQNGSNPSTALLQSGMLMQPFVVAITCLNKVHIVSIKGMLLQQGWSAL
jgi:hypothetical protein